MGLRVVISAAHKTTTPVSFKEPLLTHEEVLQVLAGAIKKGGQPKLDKLEIMRLKVLIDATKTYDSVLEKFVRWIEIESRLLEPLTRVRSSHSYQWNLVLKSFQGYSPEKEKDLRAH